MDRSNRYFACFAALPLLAAALAVVGCNLGGSGSAASPAAVMAGVTVQGSGQGQAGGFADVDGDGIDDLLVCAPNATTPSGIGGVIVHKGTPDGFTPDPILLLTGDTNFGYAFARLDDVDGDGKDDFAVSALNGGGDDVSLSGSVSVFKGGGNGRLIRKIAGEAALDKFGYALAAADLDADGKKELLIGAPFRTPEGRPDLYQAGAVYRYDFASGRLGAIAASSATKGLGWKIATGDINGDGTEDLVLGATGKAIAFYGKADFAPSVDSPDVTVGSGASGFGADVAVVGDVNGDGYGDLAVSAIYAYGAGSNSVFIVAGGTGSRSISLAAPSADLLTRIDGETPYDAFGTRIVAVGDPDLDGRSDFAVSAVHADCDAIPCTGKVYLLYGKDLASPSTSLAVASAFKGGSRDMHFGRFMTPFEKNGTKLLIGAPTTNANTGSIHGVSLADGQPVFQVDSGGGTTIDDGCCASISSGGR